MPKKKEKIIEQVFKADLVNEDTQLPLLKDLTFLENINYHSVVRCESKGKERRGRRIVLLPRHMKELLNSFDEKLEEERNLFTNDRKKFVQEKKRFAQERHSFNKELRKLHGEIDKLRTEYKALNGQNEALNKANDQLRKNIEDKSLKEYKRPKHPLGFATPFDDAAPQLRGLPYQGGAPGLGKK
jgi:septal ring factor EnvC (AmiA/AmiB activator)